MAQQGFAGGFPNQYSTTVIRDVRGTVILEIGLEKYSLRDANGTIHTFSRSHNIMLVDGSVWNPSFSAKPGIFIGVCESCRHPQFSIFRRETPTHGLCGLHNATRCTVCHSLCCPSHSILCGETYKCPKCAKSHGLLSFLGWIFFKEQEK